MARGRFLWFHIGFYYSRLVILPARPCRLWPSDYDDDNDEEEDGIVHMGGGGCYPEGGWKGHRS